MTTSLSNGVFIPDEDLYIWKAYDFTCLVCGELPVCLHEDPPKSLNPNWKEQPETRYPVCNACHQFLHSIGRQEAKFLLDSRRDEHFPNAVKEIGMFKGSVRDSIRELIKELRKNASNDDLIVIDSNSAKEWADVLEAYLDATQ